MVSAGQSNEQKFKSTLACPDLENNAEYFGDNGA